MLRIIRLLSGLALLLSFGLSAQQTQTTSTTPPVQHQTTTTPSMARPANPPATQPALSNNNHYINSIGDVVHSPAKASSVPAGASAVCCDGTYSFSQHRQGTCSHHGGVSRWL